MTLLTIHRGTKEIGGSCVELRHGDHRLILDLGLPLVDESGDDFQLPLDANAEGLLADGVLPAIPSLLDGDDAGKTAIVITHAHQDHHGLLRFVHPDLPVYMTWGTAALLRTSLPFIRDAHLPKNISTITPWEKVPVGSFTVTPYLVDHSAPDAVALLVEVNGKSLFYTGDFRATGRKAKVYDNLLKRPPKDIDLLLMEGTMFGREGEAPVTEDDLEQSLAEMLAEAESLTVLFASGQNLDRLVTAFRAAKRTGKTLVIDLYQAWVLRHLRGLSSSIPQADWDKIRVYFAKWHADSLGKAGREGFVYGQTKNRIQIEEIAANPSDFLFMARSNNLIWRILDKLPDQHPPHLIWSLWAGYLDKPSPFNDELKRRELPLTHLHTSGHATVADLKRLAEALQPKRIVPIHTFHPDKFSTVFNNVSLAKDGVAFEL
ncbi:MBL fold metallo-hydrolase [bacterium]|nr:MBL fold metallo-hydrolase [bacterium]